MTNSVAVKKQFCLYFALPFVAFLALYGVIFSAINRHWGQPFLTFSTLAKYTISRAFDFLNFDFLRFDVPEEYAGYIAASGYPAPDIQARFYHSLLDLLPLNVSYFYFPFFLILAAAICFVIMIKHPAPAEKIAKKDKYLRGTKKVDDKTFIRQSHNVQVPGIELQTTAGKLLLDRQREKEHSLILGATGSGKSTLLIAMLQQLLSRGTRAVIIDRKGEFYSYFGTNENDILFNPYDARSVSWNIFDEINFDLDENGMLIDMPADVTYICDNICDANNLKNKNIYFNAGAASVLASAIVFLSMTITRPSMRDLVNFLTSSMDQIIAAFKTLKPGLNVGLNALGDGQSQAAANILSTVSVYTKQFACFVNSVPDAEPFSFRRWIKNSSNDNKYGNLYISTAGRNDNNFTRIVSLGVDLIGREIKDFKDCGSQDTQLIFLVDELAAYPAMQTLRFLLTQARSKGVSVIIANQSFERLKAVYGDKDAHDLVENAKSHYFFSLPEATDAKYISATIGSAEVQRCQHSRNESRGAWLSTGQARSGENISFQITKDECFTSDDIANLQTGEFICSLPNLRPSVAKLRLVPVKIEPLNEPFQAQKTYSVSAGAISKLNNAIPGIAVASQKTEDDKSAMNLQRPEEPEATPTKILHM